MRLALAGLVCAEVGNYLDFDYVHHGEDWQFGECSSRDRQSPVDFGGNAPWERSCTPATPCNPFYFDYATVDEFLYQNNGHSIAMDVGGKGIGGIVYDMALPSSAGFYNLLNVNFHTQSEHTYRGERLPMEAHFTHKLAGGSSLLVVAVPIVEGAPGLLEAFADAPMAFQRNMRRKSPDLNKFLQGGTYFAYDGSMTVPPCAEMVTWLVRREPLTASKTVIESITKGIMAGTSGFGNFRAALPLGDREVRVMSAQQGKPPIPLPASEPMKEPREVFEGDVSADKATIAMKKANEAVHFLDAKLVRASRAHLNVIGELGPEAPQAPVAAEAAKVAQSTLRSIAEEIGRQVKEHYLNPPA
jgi:carbonic anhydrase